MGTADATIMQMMSNRRRCRSWPV